MTPRSPQDRTQGAPGSGSRRALALLDLFLFVVLLVLGYQIVSTGLESARRRATLRTAVTEARALYDAFQRYYEINRAYPRPGPAGGLDLVKLDPLRRRGYYTGSIGKLLLDGRIDAYDAPSDKGPNREFWLEMTLECDPRVRLLVARSDDAPLGGGKWTDGVVVLRDGKVESI